FDMRAQQLEQEEDKLNAARERLEREADALVAQSEQADAEALRRVGDAEAIVARLRKENDHLRRAAERAAAELPPPAPVSTMAEEERLEARRRELDEYAAQLERTLEALERQAGEKAPAAPADAETERLRDEVRVRDARLAGLQEKITGLEGEIEERDRIL